MMFRQILSQAQRVASRNALCHTIRQLNTVNIPVRNFSSEIKRQSKQPATIEEAEESLEMPNIETYDPNASASMCNIKLDGSSRRFYRSVSISPEGDGKYAVRLSGNIAHTPGGNSLILPSKAYAMMVALEFENQKKFIYPHTMPLTNLALTVIDRLPTQREFMTENCLNILRYDSTCYRDDCEDSPGLVRLQEKHFDPLLKWFKTEFNAPLEWTFELRTIDQPETSLVTIERMIRSMDDYTFACFESLTLIGKSVVVSLAFIKQRLSLEQAFKAIRLEENFQVQVNGRVEGIYGTVVNEEFTKLRLASCRSALNLINYKL